jgi:hypothetical protein
MKIGLDVDEVLASWMVAWAKRYNFKEMPKSWKFDPLILERFDIMRETGELDEFYLNLDRLIDPSELPFEPHCYITSRPVETDVTAEWLRRNGFPSKRVYTVPLRTSKVAAAKNARVDIFVDDAYHNFLDLNENGIKTYLLTRDHNIQFDVGDLRLNSLKDIPLIVEKII